MYYKRTKAALEDKDALYVHCPDCDGERKVAAQRNGISQYFDCPTCSATGESSREDAITFIDIMEDNDDV